MQKNRPIIKIFSFFGKVKTNYAVSTQQKALFKRDLQKIYSRVFNKIQEKFGRYKRNMYICNIYNNKMSRH